MTHANPHAIRAVPDRHTRKPPPSAGGLDLRSAQSRGARSRGCTPSSFGQRLVPCEGFTLMELLVVVLIIGLLTGIVAPRLLGQINRSEVTTARAQIDAFDKALQAFRIDMGRFPTDSEGLKALVEAPGADPRWRGPYLKGTIPMDPWGSLYGYRSRSSGGSGSNGSSGLTGPSGAPGKDFDLWSLGRDKAEGGAGDDADIRN